MLALEKTKDPTAEVEQGLGLMQLKTEPKQRNIRSVKKEKMASSRGKKTKKPRVKRSKSTDNTRIVELRKERSRDAARSRRGKENAQFDELAKLLPLPGAIASQLDKASIVRLTISYLDMKQFVRRARRDRQSSDTSLFSESSASPMSECGTDGVVGSPESPSPNSSVSSPPFTAAAVVPYNPVDTSSTNDFAADSGLHLLQALDGFLFVLSSDGKVLYVSETVSVHLGLSQVELTGSSMYGYLHPDDHQDLTNVLDAATQELENIANQAAAGMYNNDIPFFGCQKPFSGGNSEKPKSFFLRMKCTLVRRGGAYTKSSGFKVIHCMGRMKKYSAIETCAPKYAFVAIGQPLPTMNINELPLECNMFVSRVNMDLRIVYCEGRIHRFMDYFARDIVGISAYDFYHGNDIAVIQSHHAKFLTKGQVLTKYYRWMNKNGGWVWMQTKASLIPHPTNPELKQMLCLNYIVSDVEHRGVVLGMAQLDDKPLMQKSGAYITEVENESDTTGGDLKDAQFDDQVMVYPKWHETSDNLVPKPTILDTLALNRTGYDLKSTGLDNTSTLDNEVFSTAPSQWPQASTSVSASRTSGGSALAATCSSSSTLDDLEDISEIIDAEMTELDRELLKYVVVGADMPLSPGPTDKNPGMQAENDTSGAGPSNDNIQTGLPFGASKVEQVAMEEQEFSTASNPFSVKDSDMSSQGFGSLSLGIFPNDDKISLLPMDQEDDLLELTFTTESSKLRGTSSPCMYSNTRGTSAGGVPATSRLDTPPTPVSVSSTLTTQQVQSLRNASDANVMKMPSAIPPRSVAYTSQSRNFGSSALQRSEVTSTVTSTGTSSFHPSAESCNARQQNEEQMRFLQQLKASFPPDKSFSDELLVDLVDEMIQDAAVQRRNDRKLESILQQGGYYQTDRVVKQEVVTPTMPQPTSSFGTFFDTLAAQGSQQPTGMYNRSGVQKAGGSGFNGVSTNTMSQCPGNQPVPGTFRRSQNGTTRLQSDYAPFIRQEDSNMNFLNSLSNGGTSTNNSEMLMPSNHPWTSNQPPKQQTMQQSIRDILQTTNNTAAKQTPKLTPPVNSNLLSQQSLTVLPQQNVNTLPQSGLRSNQSDTFNTMTMNPTMNPLDFQQSSQMNSMLQSVLQQDSGYHNQNVSNMMRMNHCDPVYDFSGNL